MVSKPGRNDACHCGSAKKYKKCCLANDEAARPRPAPPEPAAEPWLMDPEWEPPVVRGHGVWRDKFDPELFPEASARPRTGSLPLAERPPLDAEVEGWWGKFEDIRDDGDPHEALRAIHRVLDERPDLVERLRLEEEAIPELCDELLRAGEPDRAVELLLRVRKDHPRVYEASGGSFDVTLIVEALVAGRRPSITGYFDHFKQDPNGALEWLSQVVDILLATNCGPELMELAGAVGQQVYRADRALHPEFVLDWLALRAYIPAFESRDASPAAARQVVDRLRALDIGLEPQYDLIAEDLESTLGAFPAPSDVSWHKKEERERYYRQVMCNFTGWLHDHRGLTWPSARAFASEIGAYLPINVVKKGGRNPFRFDPPALEKYVLTHCRRIFFDGVQALTMLQSVWWFAEYLSANGQDAGTTDPILSASESVAARIRGQLDPIDTGRRLLANLAEYRWSDPLSAGGTER